MVRGYREARERRTRSTKAPGSSPSAPLHFAVASYWLYAPHLTLVLVHLIPEAGQMALLSAQSPERECLLEKRGKHVPNPHANRPPGSSQERWQPAMEESPGQQGHLGSSCSSA